MNCYYYLVLRSLCNTAAGVTDAAPRPKKRAMCARAGSTAVVEDPGSDRLQNALETVAIPVAQTPGCGGAASGLFPVPVLVVVIVVVVGAPGRRDPVPVHG